MISIDSDMLRGLVSCANAAVDQIDEGVRKLNAVVEHDDWNCVERDRINEKISLSKKEILALYNSTQAFLSAIKRVSDKFDESDRESVKAFEDVNLSLSNFFAVKTPLVVTADFRKLPKIINYIDGLQENIKFDSLLEEFEAASLLDGLKICSFSDINLSGSK